MNHNLNRTLFLLSPLLIGLVVQTLPLIGWSGQYLPGDLGDTRFNIYVLENAYQFFSGKTESFWGAGFMHPEAEVISLSDNLVGSMPIYALFRLIGLDVFGAFQGWFIILTLLNYFSAYFFLKHLTKDVAASGLGAFIFTFSIGLAAQMNHAQMFPRFAIPLMLLFALLWIQQFKPFQLFIAISLLTYQFFCGIYLGFMAFVPFTVIIVYGVIHSFSDFWQSFKALKNIGIYCLAVLFNGMLIWKLFQPYLRRAEYADLHEYDQIVNAIPSVLSYFSAFPGNPIHHGLEKVTFDYPAYWDHWIFPGWLALFGFIFMVVALFLKKIQLPTRQKVIGITGCIVFLVFMRFGEVSFYELIQKIPGFASMRSLTRIINIQILFFATGFALFYIFLSQRTHRNELLFFGIALFTLSIDNYVPSTKVLRVAKHEITERHDEMLARLKDVPAGSVVSVESRNFQGNIKYFHLDVMLATQELGLKSVNGYSGMAPYYFDRYWENPNEETRNFYFQRFTPEEIGEIIVIQIEELSANE